MESESYGRTRSNSHKLENKEFRPVKKERKKKKKKPQNTKRVVKHWNGLSREVVETPYLKMLKPWLKKTLSDLL